MAQTAPSVAVLMNGSSLFRLDVKKSFSEALSNVSPDSRVDFYDPIEAQAYPDPRDYDLIVLSGGTVDPMSTDVPWVLKMHDFLRMTVKEYPQQKLLGICWGHQTIHVAFGGRVGGMEKAELGVIPVTLTLTGREFFSFSQSGKLDIHQFHKRDVKSPACGFEILAHDAQVFLNKDNTILTLQGHPEMSVSLAKLFLSKAPSYMCVDGEEKVHIAQTMEKEHDGYAIWKRIFEWIRER